jgi:N-acetylmuramoyl-L-alanine amidase
MKIGLRGGHSANCIGAVGFRDEYQSMQSLFVYVKEALELAGHEIVNCNSNGYTASQELSEGINEANSNNVDLFMSLHMNASNGQGHGVEAWIYNESSGAKDIAQRLVNNYGSLGFYNRGVKYGGDSLYELRESNAPAIIFENCFCDNAQDIEIWHNTDWEVLAKAIVTAIDPSILELDKSYQVRVYSFASKQDAEKASQEITSLGYYNVVEEM